MTRDERTHERLVHYRPSGKAPWCGARDIVNGEWVKPLPLKTTDVERVTCTECVREILRRLPSWRKP